MNDSSSPSRKLRYQLKPILCIAHWNTIVFVTLFLLTYHSSDVALEDNNIVLYSRCVCVWVLLLVQRRRFSLFLLTLTLARYQRL